METLRRTQSRSSSTRLVTRILERPELMAAVRELPAPVLATLIDSVGLEDAGEIVALASPAQLERVLDQDVWHADAPGEDERFAPERFALWLSVMLEAGEDFVVQRLCELPRDLLTLAIHRLVRVMDSDSLAAQTAADEALQDAPYEAWEEFRLVARDLSAWDVLWTCLLALDRDHHDLLRSLLEHCCALNRDIVEDDSGLYDVLDSDEVLENDVAAEREDRRSAGGYVSAADARSFLELSRRGGDARERDPITRAYFRAVEDAGAEPPSPAPPPYRATERSVSGKLATQRSDLSALVELLRAADVVERPTVAPTGTPALVAPRTHDGAERPAQGAARRTGDMLAKTPSATTEDALGATLLDAVMSELGVAHPKVFAERVEELGYLANVLIAGSSHAGRTLRPATALECAVAVCNLGLGDAIGEPHSIASATACLLQTPADRLFRDGYRSLHLQLIGVARALLETLCTAQHRVDLLARVRQAFGSGTPFQLQDEVDAAELGLDDASFTALLALTETCPWLSGSLARGGRPFIASRRDLRVALEFCASVRAISVGA